MAGAQVVDGADLLWTPPRERVAASRLAAFVQFVNTRGWALEEGDYLGLWQRSVEDLEAFWGAVADFFAVDFTTPARAVLGRREMPGAEWFPGAELSYPAHVFRGRRDEDLAILQAGEVRPLGEVTWGELRELTAQIAAGLRAAGVGRGDRVAGYVPNIPEAVAMFLATASVGAVWASCSPDFGAAAVLDRLGQIKPKVLFTVDGYRYGGRDFDRLDIAMRIASQLEGLRRTVVLPYLEPQRELKVDAQPWEEFLATGDGGPLTFAPVPFEHPLWVLYTSGTTGLPKGLVHSQGGILLEHLKWLGLQTDLTSEDRLFWLTTTGWTMWNFLVGGLLTGTPIVTFDGNPATPDMGTLWRLAHDAGATCFGAGASFYTACMKAGLRPGEEYDVSRLRSVGSTGSPLPPDAFDWIYDAVGRQVWLFSTSGGTDVCTAFVGGAPFLPVRRGELQAPALGVDLQAWDPDGRRLPVGEVGELVVTQPMPSMPVGLWNDPDGSRYRAAYFEMYPGVWRHGDWIEMRASGGAVIHGRSDATINRGGIRIGSAELYRVVLALPEIADAAVVDAPVAEDRSELLLFVALADGARLDAALTTTIRDRLRTDCSPRHLPDEIIAAPGIPRTLSGKVLETPIRRLLDGAHAETVASRDALSNPEALDWFAAYARDRRGETPGG